MSGQIWSVDADGGYQYSDQLSDDLRQDLIPMTKFRQFTELGDGHEQGLNRGDTFRWNVYSKIARSGRRLEENQRMPESQYTVQQHSLTVYEGGNSVPYSGKLEALSQHETKAIIDKTLRLDARNYFDAEAYLQFDQTKLRAVAASGTSTTAIALAENGTTGVTNNVAMGNGHVKAITDEMRERNIPAHIDDDYCCLSRPKTLRPLKDDLEGINQYTDVGIQKIFNGEIGRYDGCRFIAQTGIAEGGAIDSTTFDAYDGTGDAWNNALSSWAFYFGGDTVKEAVVQPEEIRAKMPGDYGRDKGMAWYYLGGFGIVHDDALNSRIVKWDSAA